MRTFASYEISITIPPWGGIVMEIKKCSASYLNLSLEVCFVLKMLSVLICHDCGYPTMP